MSEEKSNKKTSLPVFPNGKGHISYSEIIDWVECSYRHKLKHVKKIDLDSGSIHTAFGTAIHEAGERFLIDGKLPPIDDIKETFKKELKALPEEAQNKALEQLPEFLDNLPDMIGQIPDWVNKQWPSWQLVEAEKFLYEQIEKQDNVKFKGYIDGVIKVEKKPTKKLLKEYADKGEECPTQWEYVILDWKTTSWGWKVDMKRSFEKQMQLILYKHFFCKATRIPLNQVKCGFVLIKRSKPTNGKRLEFVPVSVGPKSIDKALKVLHNMINQVRIGFATKNRKYCKPFCPYAGTSHCP